MTCSFGIPLIPILPSGATRVWGSGGRDPCTLKANKLGEPPDSSPAGLIHSPCLVAIGHQFGTHPWHLAHVVVKAGDVDAASRSLYATGVFKKPCLTTARGLGEGEWERCACASYRVACRDVRRGTAWVVSPLHLAPPTTGILGHPLIPLPTRSSCSSSLHRSPTLARMPPRSTCGRARGSGTRVHGDRACQGREGVGGCETGSWVWAPILEIHSFLMAHTPPQRS
jgi:hypothetical protein